MSAAITLWPAVDIRDGHAVQLTGGAFDRETVYDADPATAAQRWTADGARALHIVDLDGARAGAPANLEHVRRIAVGSRVPIQVGGGLRDEQAVGELLGAGADRAILGTAALRDPGFARAMVAAHGPERIVVSVDVRGGLVATAGWQQQTDDPAAPMLERLREGGVRSFVVTCIDRDGHLAGPDLSTVRDACRAVPDCEVIYSGGVGSVEHLSELRASAPPALRGVIVGTALYERRFTVAEGQHALDPDGSTPAR